MNARQKAKYYKRKYERLLNEPVKFSVEQHKIDTIRFERFYPAPLIILEHHNHIREAVTRDIAQYIASHLNKYVDYRTDFCPSINEYRLLGEIRVVDRMSV